MTDAFPAEDNSKSSNRSLNDSRERKGDSEIDSPAGMLSGLATSSSELKSDIIVSSRINLSRNLSSYPFLNTCSQRQRAQIYASLLQARWVNENRDRFRLIDCQHTKLNERHFFTDLQAIIGLICALDPGDGWPTFEEEDLDSRLLSSIRSIHSQQSESFCIADDLSAHQESAAEASRSNQTVQLIFNNEEHLQLEVESFDAKLQQAWQLADQIDDQFQEQFGFAFHPTLGYLTASPAEVGTGMRASILLHLPAAVAMGTLPKVANGLGRNQLALREAFGDPSGGDFFRLCNLTTLGIVESEMIDRLQNAASEIVELELESRQQWKAESNSELIQNIQLAVRKSSRMRLESADSQVQWGLLRTLSRLRLGLQLGVLVSADCRKMAGRFLMDLLNQWLKIAIHQEDYRTASRLRDQIKQLGDAA